MSMSRKKRSGQQRIRKGAGLVSHQRQQIIRDVYEESDDEASMPSRRWLEDVGSVEPDGLPEGFEDEEIESSDGDVGGDDDSLLLPRVEQARKGGKRDGNSRQVNKDKMGSQADSEEYEDLSRMLDDHQNPDDDDTTNDRAFSSADDRMLRALGLAAKRQHERTETHEEADFAAAQGDLSIDAILGSLKNVEGFGQLRRDIVSLSRVAGHRAGRVRLDAPLERTDQRRTDRQAATAAAHGDVSGWQQAVTKNHDAEVLRFPLDRQARVAGTSTASLTAVSTARTDLERGVQELLEREGLDEGSVARAEQLELADIGENEIKKRTAELRKMRDLLFHHERKLKRASKIK